MIVHDQLFTILEFITKGTEKQQLKLNISNALDFEKEILTGRDWVHFNQSRTLKH